MQNYVNLHALFKSQCLRVCFMLIMSMTETIICGVLFRNDIQIHDQLPLPIRIHGPKGPSIVDI